MAIVTTEDLGELKFRIKVITLEAKTQSLKYQPSGFGLELVSEIIYGASWSPG